MYTCVCIRKYRYFYHMIVSCEQGKRFSWDLCDVYFLHLDLRSGLDPLTSIELDLSHTSLHPPTSDLILLSYQFSFRKIQKENVEGCGTKRDVTKLCYKWKNSMVFNQNR